MSSKYFDENEYEIYIEDFLEDGIGSRNTRAFFHNIIKKFAEESFKFHGIWDEFPFVYKERQVNSALIPAIYKCTDNIWLEQPFKKIKGDQRFLDIVTIDKDNIYLVELKHTYNSKTEKVADYAHKEWRIAIRQLSDVNKKTLGGYYNYKKFNVFKIALMIMPTYLNSDNLSDTENKLLDLNASDYNNKISQEYDGKPWTKKAYANLIGTIKIKNSKNYIHEWRNANQIYPFVSFVVRIEKL